MGDKECVRDVGGGRGSDRARVRTGLRANRRYGPVTKTSVSSAGGVRFKSWLNLARELTVVIPVATQVLWG